jgi:hypothetical protein
MDMSTQNGNMNVATVDQTGLMNVNQLNQDGNRNTADIDQVGILNTNEAESLGNRNAVDVEQTGVGNSNLTSQTGNRNEANLADRYAEFYTADTARNKKRNIFYTVGKYEYCCSVSGRRKE